MLVETLKCRHNLLFLILSCFHVFVLGARSNFVTVSGSNYATLANTNPNSYSSGGSCQKDTYLPLPAGWIIAPYNCQTAFAASCYGWNTAAVTLSDGSYTCTKSTGSSAFYHSSGNNWLLTNSSSGSGGVATYSVNHCYHQILITDNVNAAAAACPNLPTTCK